MNSLIQLIQCIDQPLQFEVPLKNNSIGTRSAMLLRSWQEKIISDFPTIIKRYKKFILKAPTGAGKTILASEIVERFYKSKKDIE